MTLFAKAEFGPNGELKLTNTREIKQSDIQRCPNVIFDADHYWTDGSCKCYDPNATEMKEWGYVWKDGQWR